jgi:cobalt-zinc-cadmium efflux system membrane fusion protein
MKKALLVALATVGIIAIAGVALAFVRPDLMPAWAKPKAPTQAQTADNGPFCDEHGVPEKFCTICHPELKEKLLLCPEHGNIPEDICTLCHPDVKKKLNIETCEHGLPKHFCYLCKAEKGGDQTSNNLINDGYCAEFGEAGPDGLLKCKLLPIVRLASAEVATDAGLRTAPVAEEEHVHELFANAETDYDANRYAEIHPRVAGFLREVRLDLGQSAKARDVVAVVDSAEVSNAKVQYITARSAHDLATNTYARTSALGASQAIAAKQVIADRSAMNQAQASLLNAEQKLRNFRFNDSDLARILKENDTRPLLDITTPLGGTVVFRHAVLGEAVEPTTKLYTVADTSTVWLWIDVYERDMAKVEPGQKVTFTVMGGGPEETPTAYEGKVTWIGSEVDQTTRTTKVRAELPNPGRKLRAHQFGKARVELGTPHRTLTVAKRAVQRYENVDLVFLNDGPGVYRPQRIKAKPIGRGELMEVSWGLKPGQSVVTDGSFLLKTEIMKGSIGAGCCD